MRNAMLMTLAEVNAAVSRATGVEIAPDYPYWGGEKTLEYGLPWLTPCAIIRLCKLLQPDFTVVEFGCGGSTVFFAQRCKTVYTFEDNADFLHQTREELNRRGLTNATLHHTPTKEAYLQAIDGLSKDADCILVDNNNPIGRCEIGEAAIHKLKDAGIFVLDNYYRTESIVPTLVHNGWVHETYDDIYWSGAGTKIVYRGVLTCH